MNSVAIIETPAGQDRLYYMVSVLSNVLRKNSAEDHRDLARAVHAHAARRPSAEARPPGEKPPSATYGEGFIGYEAERKELTLKVDTQEALLALGYEIGDIDGVIGSSHPQGDPDLPEVPGDRGRRQRPPRRCSRA